MKTAVYLSCLAVGLLCLLACEHGKSPGAQGPADRRSVAAPPIQGLIVKPTFIDRSVTVSGTLKPFEETVLMSEASGRVVSVHLPEGKTVRKGTVLLKLFDDDLQAQLRKAQAQLDIAKQTQARLSELLKINGVSRTEYDNATLNVNSLSADVELMSVQIRKTEIRAPFDGLLGLKQISVGAQITPSTPLVTIRAVDRMKLDFSVPEKYASEITPGMKCTFSVEGGDTSYAAAVMATEGGVEAATRNLRVRAIVDEPAAVLKPGAFAKVKLVLGNGADALMIPTHAIIPEERSKRVVVARSGRAQFITVITGVRRDTDIEVVKGLVAGDTLVTTGLLFLKPGSELKFSKVMH